MKCKLKWDLAVTVSIFFNCCKKFISSFIPVIILPLYIYQSSPISDFKPRVHRSLVGVGGQKRETEKEYD